MCVTNTEPVITSPAVLTGAEPEDTVTIKEQWRSYRRHRLPAE